MDHAVFLLGIFAGKDQWVKASSQNAAIDW